MGANLEGSNRKMAGKFAWIYAGMFQNGKRHGLGVCMDREGGVYAGYWKHGLRHYGGVERHRDRYVCMYACMWELHLQSSLVYFFMYICVYV